MRTYREPNIPRLNTRNGNHLEEVEEAARTVVQCVLSFRGFGMQSSVPRGEYLTSSAGRREEEKRIDNPTIEPSVYKKQSQRGKQDSIANCKHRTDTPLYIVRRPSSAPATRTPPTPHTRWGRGFVHLQARWLVGNSHPADAPDLEPRERFYRHLQVARST